MDTSLGEFITTSKNPRGIPFVAQLLMKFNKTRSDDNDCKHLI